MNNVVMWQQGKMPFKKNDSQDLQILEAVFFTNFFFTQNFSLPLKQIWLDGYMFMRSSDSPESLDLLLP